MSDSALRVRPRPRLPLYKLLNADIGIGHDVTLRVFNGDGKVEGELKAHCIILALGSSILEGLLFNKAGEMTAGKVVEVRGASMKTAKWMLDFLYFKPTEQCGWDEATAEEIFLLASLAEQFQIIELQEKVEALLSAFPMEKEDILEVASIAVHFEIHFPAASKALLDKCTSLLVSTMHTAEDFARFAEQASKDSHLAPLVVKLLAGMGNCKKLLQEVKEEKIGAKLTSRYGAQASPTPSLRQVSRIPPCSEEKTVDAKKAEVAALLTSQQESGAGTKSGQKQKTLFPPSPSVKERNKLGHSSVKRGDILRAVLKNVGVTEKEAEVCPNCKGVKAYCRNGQEVSFISPAQVGCRVVTEGPYWSGDCQGMLATVVEALNSETMTVRWEVEWSSKAGKLRRVGTLTTYKLFPPVPHAKGKPAFRYLCT